MPLSVLVQTSHASAEATVERLLALGIDAHVIDEPNALVKLASGGSYRVRVAVPETELERARAELARWEVEAGPRVNQLARGVERGLLLTWIPPLVPLGVWLTRPGATALLWAALGLWLGGLLAWIAWSRRAR